MKPIPLTEDVRRDLWLFFGETNIGPDTPNWPALPVTAIAYPRGSLPVLTDCPFTRAFMAWRSSQ